MKRVNINGKGMLIRCGLVVCLSGCLLGCAKESAVSETTAEPSPMATVKPTVPVPTAEPTVIAMEIATTPEPKWEALPTPVPRETGTPVGGETADATDAGAQGTPIAVTELTYVPSVDFPFPDGRVNITRGRRLTVGGTVLSPMPLTCITADIYKGKKSVSSVSVTFAPEDNVLTYELVDLTFAKDGNPLSEQIRFDRLKAGEYTLTLTAETADQTKNIIATGDFTVVERAWIQLLPNNLRGSYSQALAFFGDEEKFLFTFKVKETGSNSIVLNGEWSKKYVSKAQMPFGEWTVHKDAVPYFEQAGEYMKNSYVHIHGTNGDTGALQLTQLVELNGTMVRRFVNSGRFISHHSFGTAVDLNAYVDSNRDVLTNREKIYTDVTNNLVYNGIVEADGVLCYDFTYNGKAKNAKHNVPETVLNYLLYELAFYRAGFSWGVYFPHTSDAMHFSLTELSPSLFDSGEYAMRKVFQYAEDVAQQPGNETQTETQPQLTEN